MKRSVAFASCPQMRSTLDMLGPWIGAGEPHRFPVIEGSGVPMHAIRSRLAGASFAVIGIGDGEIAPAFRTLQAATRSHECALVVNTHGYKGVLYELQELPHVDSVLIIQRVKSAVLVGRDDGASFVGFDHVFPHVRVHTIGGLHWGPVSCEEIAQGIKDTFDEVRRFA